MLTTLPARAYCRVLGSVTSCQQRLPRKRSRIPVMAEACALPLTRRHGTTPRAPSTALALLDARMAFRSVATALRATGAWNRGRSFVCTNDRRSDVRNQLVSDEGGDASTGAAPQQRVPEPPQRVVVGMSGGVDSSVAAMLLQQQGYEVVGVFMRNWDGRDEEGSDVCTADADLEDARSVSRCLGIYLETVDFSREYWHDVFAPSMEEFARCRTPNMDVACNRFIKFDVFRAHAMRTLGADLVATGHYARTRPGPGDDWDNPELIQAEDANKDQTYFLCGVPSSALAKVLFPLGGLTKPKVRELAEKAGLPVARKRESMGVCFVGKRKRWADFLAQYITPRPGNFICVDTGEVLGKHEGVQFYTIGQKSHLDGMPEKCYVVRLEVETGAVIVARGRTNPTLYARGLSCLASEFHWVAGVPPVELHRPYHGGLVMTKDGYVSSAAAPSADSRPAQEDTGRLHCLSRCRHRAELSPCTVELHLGGRAQEAHPRSARNAAAPPSHAIAARDSDVRPEQSGFSSRGSEVRAGESPLSTIVVVRFEEPEKAVAPGQILALYKDGVCLGGGPILRAEEHCSRGVDAPPR